MPEFSINITAIIVAVMIRMALGGFWYSPVAFGPIWRNLVGVSEAEMRATLPKALAADVVGSVIMAFVMVHAVHYAGAQTIGQGAAVGFFNWLGFVAVTTFVANVYERRPLTLFLINNVFTAIVLVIMGAIFAVWP